MITNSPSQELAIANQRIARLLADNNELRQRLAYVREDRDQLWALYKSTVAFTTNQEDRCSA